MSAHPAQVAARADEAARVRALSLPAPEAVTLPNGAQVFVRALTVAEHLEGQGKGLSEVEQGVRLAGCALAHADGTPLFSPDEGVEVVSRWPQSWLEAIVDASTRLSGARDGLDVVEVARRD